MKTLCRFALLLSCLCLMPSLAYAQSSLPSWDQIASLLLSIKGAGTSMYGTFLDEGIGMASVFVGIMIAWYLMQYSAADIQIKADLFKYVMVAMMTMYMLNNWAGSTQSLMVGTFDTLRDQVVSQGVGGGGTQMTLAKGVGTAYANIRDAMLARQKARDAYLASLSNVFDRVAAGVMDLPDIAMAYFMGLVVGFLAFILILGFFAVVFLGDLMVIIGMTLGPLMVPGLVFPPLNHLWQSWLKFMISAGFYKIIAGIIVVLTLKTVNVIQSTAAAIYNENQAASNTPLASYPLDVIMYWTIILYMLLGIWMMRKSMDLTKMLMSGAGGPMFSPPNPLPRSNKISGAGSNSAAASGSGSNAGKPSGSGSKLGASSSGSRPSATSKAPAYPPSSAGDKSSSGSSHASGGASTFSGPATPSSMKSSRSGSKPSAVPSKPTGSSSAASSPAPSYSGWSGATMTISASSGSSKPPGNHP